MIIYKIINLLNNKIYIGQYSGNNFENYYGSGLHIKRAIKKYGKENFKKEIIEYCDSKEHLNEREIYWIDYYNSRDNSVGYNIALGGKCVMLGRKHSEESKQKMSEKKSTKEYKEKMSKFAKNIKLGYYNKGKKRTEETKKKISQSNKGKKRTLEQRQRMSKSQEGKSGEKNSFYGRKHTKESKQKMSESHKNISKETREKMSKSQKGRTPWNKNKKMTDKYKDIQRITHLGKKASKETREKMSKSMIGKNKGKKRTLESRLKMSNSQKLLYNNGYINPRRIIYLFKKLYINNLVG